MDEYYPPQNSDDYQQHQAEDRHRQEHDQDRFGQQGNELSSQSSAKSSEAVRYGRKITPSVRSSKLQGWTFPSLHC
jgi:hypothetical protein